MLQSVASRAECTVLRPVSLQIAAARPELSCDYLSSDNGAKDALLLGDQRSTFLRRGAGWQRHHGDRDVRQTQHFQCLRITRHCPH